METEAATTTAEEMPKEEVKLEDARNFRDVLQFYSASPLGWDRRNGVQRARSDSNARAHLSHLRRLMELGFLVLDSQSGSLTSEVIFNHGDTEMQERESHDDRVYVGEDTPRLEDMEMRGTLHQFACCLLMKHIKRRAYLEGLMPTWMAQSLVQSFLLCNDVLVLAQPLEVTPQTTPPCTHIPLTTEEFDPDIWKTGVEIKMSQPSSLDSSAFFEIVREMPDEIKFALFYQLSTVCIVDMSWTRKDYIFEQCRRFLKNIAAAAANSPSNEDRSIAYFSTLAPLNRSFLEERLKSFTPLIDYEKVSKMETNEIIYQIALHEKKERAEKATPAGSLSRLIAESG